MSLTCRSCDGNLYLKDIFESDGFIAQQLMSIANVQVQQNDLLSQKICMGCISQLESYYKFKLRCEEVDKKYRDNISLVEVNVDEILPIKEEVLEVEVSPYLNDVASDSDSENEPIIKKKHRAIKIKKKPRKTRSQYKCLRCDMVFEVFEEYKQHRRTHRKRYPCKTCPKTFNSTAHLKMHEAVHKQVNELELFKCDLCPKAYVSKTNLRRHKKSHSGIPPHLCKFCGKRFTTGYALREHEKCHIEGTSRIIKCRNCEERFKSRLRMIRHMESVHNDFSLSKKVPCEVCGKSFINERTMKWHLKKHENETEKNRPPDDSFVCDYCGKPFKYIGPYAIHRRTHTGEKPYCCSICPISFSCKSALNSHIKIHTGEKPYTCEICDKKFFKPSNLKNHMKVHTGLKPYPCSYCNKSFSENCTLKIHIRTHTGERPFVCRICDMAYIDSKSLKKHEMKHAGNCENMIKK